MGGWLLCSTCPPPTLRVQTLVTPAAKLFDCHPRPCWGSGVSNSFQRRSSLYILNYLCRCVNKQTNQYAYIQYMYIYSTCAAPILASSHSTSFGFQEFWVHLFCSLEDKKLFSAHCCEVEIPIRFPVLLVTSIRLETWQSIRNTACKACSQGPIFHHPKLSTLGSGVIPLISTWATRKSPT